MRVFYAVLNTTGELLQFLYEQKLWWVIPMVVVLLLFGGLLILSSATALGPFIYSIF